MNKHNLSMLVDFYELTMANGYLLHEYSDKTVYFDMFFVFPMAEDMPFLQDWNR